MSTSSPTSGNDAANASQEENGAQGKQKWKVAIIGELSLVGKRVFVGEGARELSVRLFCASQGAGTGGVRLLV
jgi:hypothetical protein